MLKGNPSTKKIKTSVLHMIAILPLIIAYFTYDSFSDAVETLGFILLSTIFCSYINIILHEMGHCIIGKIFGYKLLYFMVGKYHWKKENGKYKFSIRKFKGIGGLCGMLPPEKKLSQYKKALFFSGGIIINLLSALIFLLIHSFFTLNYFINLFILTIGITALIMGIINFLPITRHNQTTDGKIIWGIILNSEYIIKLMETNEIVIQLVSGVRPRDLSISELNIFDGQNNKDLDSLDVNKTLYLYYKFLDTNDSTKIFELAEMLRENIDKVPEISLPAYQYEICFIACINRQIGEAREFYELCEAILKKDHDINGLRIKAYYEYYINNNKELAAQICKEALIVADKFPIKGQALMEVDLIRNLQLLTA